MAKRKQKTVYLTPEPKWEMYKDITDATKYILPWSAIAGRFPVLETCFRSNRSPGVDSP